MTDTPNEGTPEQLAKAILDSEDRAVEQAIAKLIQERVVPLERRIADLEDAQKQP